MASNREAFFAQAHGQEFMYFGYSDLGLRTEQISTVDVQDVSIEGAVFDGLSIRNPILGAPMNCISEDKMAIATALDGAAAFIHHCNTPEEQRELVRNVYYYLNGIIDEPVLSREDETIQEVLTKLENRGKRFHTLPAIDSEGHCVGLMDETCFMLFEPQAYVKDAMRPFGTFATAGAGITPSEAYTRMRDERLPNLILLDDDHRVKGLCIIDDILRMVRSNPNKYSLDKNGHLLSFISVPPDPEEAVERVRLSGKYIKGVKIDTSHGEHMRNIDTVKMLKMTTRALKETFEDIKIGSGNISTEQTAIAVAKEEPDAVFVGQGPGEICDSANRLGIGTPQASAIYEVARGARSINPNIAIIADGGIKEPADTVKAFALGATAVMVGFLFAGTDETPVPTIPADEKMPSPHREYWGMGSERAQRAFKAARQRYGHFDDDEAPRIIFTEGHVVQVPLKGPVADVIDEHVLGIKLSMAGQGFRDIDELYEGASFMRGNNARH